MPLVRHINDPLGLLQIIPVLVERIGRPIRIVRAVTINVGTIMEER